MDNIFEELGIPQKYLKKTIKEDRYVALVHKLWLKSLVKHSKLAEFIEKSHFELWPNVTDEVDPSWIKIYVTVYKKCDSKVIPLPRIRAIGTEDRPFTFSQLMQYISQSNYRNLWKEAYKKYTTSVEKVKETQITLTSYDEVLREIIARIYGCPIINVCDSNQSEDSSCQFEAHLNILPAVCAIETLNAIFLLHIPYIEHNLNDCVTFSPAILEKCFTKPLFVVYQLLQLLKSLHDKSLTLGDINLSDVYLNEDMWIYVFPKIHSNIYQQSVPKSEAVKKTVQDCRKFGHEFKNFKCEFCGIRTYDRVQVTNENLEQLCQLWVEGAISNFTYISALNKLSGRKLGDPNCHHVFPWVTDFASRCGKNWRDLKKSKYRLNKGDRQLDLTYDHSHTQVPHHVSDVLSSITYYVYMARRTPKPVLCKNVRTVWVPAEYPSSIQRMQEWTPDECIPEFFSDPSVFRSIHNDLDDLEVPQWCSGPEDFIEKHREALESAHVSERLHYWIDLTFGYKLAGVAAIKAKNVCLHLVDEHKYLTKSGLVQLFTHPHPSRVSPSAFWAKVPPKIFVNKPIKQTSRDRSASSSSKLDLDKSEEDEEIFDTTFNSSKSPLGISKYLSRSRSSLHEEPNQKSPRTPSAQRSSSLGPKNPTFTSHVAPKVKPNQLNVPTSSLSSGIIYLPKEYKPELALELLEKKHSFITKTFHSETEKKFVEALEDFYDVKPPEECTVQNAFTNFIFSENFEDKFVKQRATKSLTFPLDNQNSFLQNFRGRSGNPKNEDHIFCNYSDIISSRRIRELQIIGCLIVEIFMSKQLRAMGANNVNLKFNQRLKACLTIVKSCASEVPACISYVVRLLLQPDVGDLSQFTYPAVSDLGLPPPSAHLLLEPLLHCIVPFSSHFPKLYSILSSLKDFKNVALELDILYHFDCNGEKCAEYENLERTKILFAQNIGECKVKTCARNLDILFDELNTNTDIEVVNILLPHIIELVEDPPTSVLAAWYLFDPVARVLGPQKTSDMLLDCILKLYENEPNETYIPYNGKIAKLYHHSFLLRLMVRLGVKCFLENFITPLVEAVGGYKDYEKIDCILHNHSEKILKKISHLKTMDAEHIEMSASDDSSVSSERQVVVKKEDKTLKEQEVFEFDEDKENEEQMKSLIEHLELNVASDLPFNHSTAEEALDATLTESIEQLKTLEDLKINLNEDFVEKKSGVTSPTIPIPSSYRNAELINISCEIGSKKSESDSIFDKNSETDSPTSSNYDATKFLSTSSSSQKLTLRQKQPDAKISEMSSDSLVWLSHRLGPVLTARYLSRNLLKMLTLCYVGKESLVSVNKDGFVEDNDISVTSTRVVGDANAVKVLECLTSMACLYGEQLILFQYLPHMSELIALCKRKLTPNLEGGLISCLALLKHIIPYLSDSTLMDQLQDVILKSILHPTVRLLGSTKYTFPSGAVARNILARKYLDALYVLSIRMGSDMTKTLLAVPTLQRFFLIFDKVYVSDDYKAPEEKPTEKDFQKSLEESHFIELKRDGTQTEWAISGYPFQISQRLKDSESDSLSPPVSIQTSTALGEENIVNLALNELRAVFTPELAYVCYLPFLRHVGSASLEISLKNHETVKNLCQEYEQELKLDTCNVMLVEAHRTQSFPSSNSIGSNISLIGNRIDVQSENLDSLNTDLLSLVSNRIENNSRHLRGNWLAYWEHEIGRSDKDTMFNFKQIKLQTFTGHTHSVKSLHVLDNENSFISGSRDKTVKLWSLRSQGDGASVSNCQWTYTAHKKSVLAVTFSESTRLVASTDSVVHIWDPFMGANVGHLENARYSPVNMVRSMPSPSNTVLAATTDGTIKVVDMRLCNYVYELKISANPTGLIRCIAISPDGLWFAAGQSSGGITVLDTRTGLVVANWRAHEGEVLQLVAVDANTLVSSSLDQTISVWNVPDGRLKFFLRGATEPVHCLNAYHAELVSGTTANRVGVHTSVDSEASFSSTKLRSDAFKGLLTSMAVLPLNRLLLLGADNGNITLLC